MKQVQNIIFPLFTSVTIIVGIQSSLIYPLILRSVYFITGCTVGLVPLDDMAQFLHSYELVGDNSRPPFTAVF
jgi:hypothetical protein